MNKKMLGGGAGGMKTKLGNLEEEEKKMRRCKGRRSVRRLGRRRGAREQ